MTLHEAMWATFIGQAVMTLLAAPIGGIVGWNWDRMSSASRYAVSIGGGLIFVSPMLLQWACMFAGRALWPLG